MSNEMKVALASGLAALAAMVAALASLVGGHTSTFENVVITGDLTIQGDAGTWGNGYVGTNLWVGGLMPQGAWSARGQVFLVSSAPQISWYRPGESAVYSQLLSGPIGSPVVEIDDWTNVDGTNPQTLCQMLPAGNGRPNFSCVERMAMGGADVGQLVAHQFQLGPELPTLSWSGGSCVSDQDGMLINDADAGLWSGHPSHFCFCGSDGAGHWAWRNVNGHIGTATTCPD